MDYEMKYKAVLKTATQWIKDGCTDKEKICLECVFPELRESEDERIIEGFKKLLNQIRRDGGLTLNLVPIDKCEAWLEKQIEPHYTKRNALFDKCVENCDPKVMKEVSDKVDEMLQKEQKPAEWSEEDVDLEEAAMNYIAPIENEEGLKVINFSGRDMKDAFKAGDKVRIIIVKEGKQ